MRFGDLLATWRSYYSFQPQFNPHLTLARACCKSPFCSGARMPTSANCPKNPSDVRADVGIPAPILPLSQQPLARGLVAWVAIVTAAPADARGDSLLQNCYECG